MPPKRKNNVPSGTPKGRRPKIAGTSGRTVSSNKPDAGDAEKQALSTPQKPTPEQSVPESKPEKADAAAADTTPTEAASTSDADKTDTDKSDTATPDQEPAPKAKVANRLPRMGARTQPTSADAAASTGSRDSKASKGKRGGGLTWKLVAILGTVAVVLGVFAAVAAYKPFARFDNTAWIDSSTTAEVTAAATEAAEATFSYGFETVDEDFDRARTFMNDEMRAEFDQTAQTTKDAVLQTQTATKADITDIGVSMLDGDRASLVAYMNVSSTNQGTAQGSTSGSLVIDMERVDGKWVLAGIRDA